MPSTLFLQLRGPCMLDNQLEKGFEVKGGMMGGVSIQQLLGKVSAADSCQI